jgi:putative heme-binding domain-containing protein
MSTAKCIILTCALCVGLCSSSVAEDPSGLAALVELLGQVDEPDFQLDLLKGMHEALEGRRQEKMPDGWGQTYPKLAKSPSAAVRDKAQRLALIFGDRQALMALQKSMLDTKAPPEARRRAITLLAENKAAGLAPTLHKLLADPATRAAALKGLAAYDDPLTPAAIRKVYKSLPEAERLDAVQTFASRETYAYGLLDAVEAGLIPSRDVPAAVARQLYDFGDAKLTERLDKLWGSVRPTSDERRAQIAALKKSLSPEILKQADLPAGRALFKKNCAQCHLLFGEGGKIGPDITGSNRANLDYILENILDPSAAVPREYRVTTIVTDDGRLISGLLQEQSERTVAIQTVNERLVLDRSTIDAIRPSAVSMMPEGLFDKLASSEIRDLVAYLAVKSQVPAEER